MKFEYILIVKEAVEQVLQSLNIKEADKVVFREINQDFLNIIPKDCCGKIEEVKESLFFVFEYFDGSLCIDEVPTAPQYKRGKRVYSRGIPIGDSISGLMDISLYILCSRKTSNKREEVIVTVFS